MGPVSTDFHDFRLFQKRFLVCLTRYLSGFRPGRPEVDFLIFSVGTKKMRGHKLCRFVVVSPREVPSLTFTCQFKILSDRSFFNILALFLSQSTRKSVH